MLPSLADCWHKAFPEDNQPKEEKEEEEEEKEEEEKEEAVVGWALLASWQAGVHALILDMNRLQ